MKETGIMFTPENIRLIREGRKTQTRRVITPQPIMEKVESFGPSWSWNRGGKGWFAGVTEEQIRNPNYGLKKQCEYFYGVPGDLLYVKEGVIIHGSIPQLVGYYMDGCRVTESWETRRTAMFMPKWAARTWLEITEVRVERVQDISEVDALAEGCLPDLITEQDVADIQISDASPLIKGLARALGPGQFTAKFQFQQLWDSINSKTYPWSSNPWVWVLTFKRV
jgi:hypothetical protein